MSVTKKSSSAKCAVMNYEFENARAHTHFSASVKVLHL